MSNERFSAGLKENTINCVALGWGTVTSRREVNKATDIRAANTILLLFMEFVCMELKFGVWCAEQRAKNKTSHFFFG
jgi:hypothetical protein